MHYKEKEEKYNNEQIEIKINATKEQMNELEKDLNNKKIEYKRSSRSMRDFSADTPSEIIYYIINTKSIWYPVVKEIVKKIKAKIIDDADKKTKNMYG